MVNENLGDRDCLEDNAGTRKKVGENLEKGKP